MKPHVLRSRLSPAVLALVLSSGFAFAAGCSGDDTTDGGDGDASPGTDASPGIDSTVATDGTVPPRDGANDTGTDTGKDATSDGASDASDGGADASDAADAADAADATADADAEAGADANDGWYDIFDPAIVPTIELTLDAAALAILSNPSPLEADQKKWAHGTFKCGATTIMDVGVRRKGSSTFRALPQKAAFKIRFDKYVPGQRFLGLSDLTLNNSMSDPTFIAERLAYHVFRSAGLPAQKANSAQVVINGDPYGLYANVETPNLDFLKRVFPANYKTSYEVNYGSDWMPGEEGGFEENVGDGTKADVTALFQAVQAANDATLLADVGMRLDTTEWLRFSATEAATGHYDGYAFGIWGSHNYFMSGDVNGAFSLSPWSTDLTFSDRGDGRRRQRSEARGRRPDAAQSLQAQPRLLGDLQGSGQGGARGLRGARPRDARPYLACAGRPARHRRPEAGGAAQLLHVRDGAPLHLDRGAPRRRPRAARHRPVR